MEIHVQAAVCSPSELTPIISSFAFSLQLILLITLSILDPRHFTSPPHHVRQVRRLINDPFDLKMSHFRICFVILTLYLQSSAEECSGLF